MTDHKEVAHNMKVKPMKRKIIQDPELDQNDMKKSASAANMMFNDWIIDWKKKSINYTSVDLSLHSTDGKPSNFLMMSQKAMKQRSKSKIMLHYKHIPLIVKEMQKCYTELLFENESTWKKNGDTSEMKEQKTLYTERLSEVYCQLMDVIYPEASNKFCEGCEMNYLSQNDHDCMRMPIDERVNLLFGYLFQLVNEENAHKLCMEKLKNEGHNFIIEKLPKPLLEDDWKERVKNLIKQKIS